MNAEGEVRVAVLGADHRNFEDGGELQLPESEARKRFSQFLRTETRSLGSDEPYSGQLMRQKGKNRILDVDLQDVKNYDAVLGQLLEENPNMYLPLVRRSRIYASKMAGNDVNVLTDCFVCSSKRQQLESFRTCIKWARTAPGKSSASKYLSIALNSSDHPV